MNVRTSLLLGVMVLVVGAWVGDQFGLLAFLDNSGSKHESEIDLVSQRIAKAESIIQQGVLTSDTLDTLEKRSLPFDTVAARSEYQDWLTKLVESNKIAQSSVEVGSPMSVTVKDGDKKPKEAYKRYAFTLSGVGRLENVTEFLFGFYRGGHLHKITSLSLAPAAGGMFNINVVGEALGIATCDRKSELSNETGEKLAFADVREYDHIVRRNIFSSEGGKTLKTISLSSITFDKSGRPEAWLKVGDAQATKRLQRGEHLDVSVHRLEVIDIQPRSALIDVDGKLVDLPIGKSIYEAM